MIATNGRKARSNFADRSFRRRAKAPAARRTGPEGQTEQMEQAIAGLQEEIAVLRDCLNFFVELLDLRISEVSGEESDFLPHSAEDFRAIALDYRTWGYDHPARNAEKLATLA